MSQYAQSCHEFCLLLFAMSISQPGMVQAVPQARPSRERWRSTIFSVSRSMKRYGMIEKGGARQQRLETAEVVEGQQVLTPCRKVWLPRRQAEEG